MHFIKYRLEKNNVIQIWNFQIDKMVNKMS